MVVFVNGVQLGGTWESGNRNTNAGSLAGRVTVRETDAFQANAVDQQGTNVLSQWAAVPVGAVVGVNYY